MRMAINKFKWFAVSVSALSLLMVVWVWPAWNSGSQNWYLGNDSVGPERLDLAIISLNTMYRGYHPPAGHNDDFVFSDSLTQDFRANEAAMTMLNFGNNGWNYHIEWYWTPGITAPMVPANDFLPLLPSLEWELRIGRWRNGMFVPFHTTGIVLSEGPGSMTNPVIISGSTMSSCTPLLFDRDDVLGARFSASRSMSSGEFNGEFNVVLNKTCYITSPLSDPGYPGAAAQVPTLSQWGMLLFAVIIAVLSVFVIRRRVRMSRH